MPLASAASAASSAATIAAALPSPTPAALPLHPRAAPQAPLFTQKSDLFHNSVFVVGYDTAVRLVKAEYYGSDQAMLLQVGGPDRADSWHAGFGRGGGKS